MSRLVVNMDSNTVPVTGLDELDSHLDSLIGEPSLPLQPALFDHVELQLTGVSVLNPRAAFRHLP